MTRIRGKLNKLVMTLDSAMCIFNLPKHCMGLLHWRDGKVRIFIPRTSWLLRSFHIHILFFKNLIFITKIVRKDS